MSLVEDCIALGAAEFPEAALGLARASLLDWLACGLAGVKEPVAEKLRAFAVAEGGVAQASVFGGGMAPARLAAMANGATSHALDFDDTHFDHVGHLSVGIYPAALAVGEAEGASAREVVAAFLAGAEAAIRVGSTLGTAHYNRGFHQTATAGAFGATVAAGRLMGLSPAQMRAALGLCATRASGLKSQFGTMGKPLNAGMAAANGVECARLAQLGLTSADDGIEGPQGFVETHTDAPEMPREGLRFAANLYKFHACCHGLHAMIEGLLPLEVEPEEIATAEIRTNPRWLKVCDIAGPRTGLEVKFSYRWLFGMVLTAVKTGDEAVYTDARAADPGLAALAEKVVVLGDPNLSDLQCSGRITLRDGTTVDFAHDLAEPLPPDLLHGKLRAKAEALLGPRGHALAERLEALDAVSAREIGAMIREDGA